MHVKQDKCRSDTGKRAAVNSAVLGVEQRKSIHTQARSAGGTQRVNAIAARRVHRHYIDSRSTEAGDMGGKCVRDCKGATEEQRGKLFDDGRWNIASERNGRQGEE